MPVVGGPYTGQLAQAINFSSSGSFDPDGTISSYHWNFGDGTSANAQNPSHVYQASGFFTATLTVTDNAGLLASATASVTLNGASEARLDPTNQKGGGGENPLSRNFNWNLPLVSLPGRAGMDLGLTLSYNSLVWTKNTAGNYITFDDDRGFPSPGFRLGFPVLQPLYYNSEVGKNAFLLIGPDGSHVDHSSQSRRGEAARARWCRGVSTSPVLRKRRIVFGAGHGADQRAESPVGDTINGRQVRPRNGNLAEGAGVCQEARSGFGEAAR